MSIKEVIQICKLMQERGVVLYGGGKEGQLALETLTKEEIHVKMIADKDVGKVVGDKQTISMEELCKRGNNEVCIITPLQICTGIRLELGKFFDIVIDNFIVHWMTYFIPQDIGEIGYMSCFPFNHYESPFSQHNELKIYREYIKKAELLDLDLNIDEQRKFYPKLGSYGSDFIKLKKEKNFRYKSVNSYFSDGDAILLHSMLREWHPKKVIEIGSGISTCVMLDTKEYWREECSDIDIICIEPYAERLYSNIRGTDKVEIKRSFVQEVDIEVFKSLSENDILFIDSSHVIRTGGDIPYEYFEILPRLKRGVLIHIHDIFYPFTYPEKWVLEGRAYNEAYLVRALLMNSNAYKIVFWNDFMFFKYGHKMEECGLPWNVLNGSSLWIRKQ